MKTIYILTFLLLSFTFIYAQNPVCVDTINPGKGNIDNQLDKIKERKTELHSDSLGNEPLKNSCIDSTMQNKYGDLLNDDPEYNKKYPIWKPAVEALGIDISTLLMTRYLMNADYARVGFSSWEYNLKKGWEWDNDRFGINFLGHPYSGSLTFSAGRTTGYNYLQSFAFSVGGSLAWEYFGENTRPSYNDIINTPINGAFLGEVLYRLSSSVLDDRTNGSERFFRELAAGIIDPVRGVNRLLQGKSFRSVNKEIYEREPVNVSLYSGVHIINDEIKPAFGKGTRSLMINAQFDYGNPFEVRSRKPFDFFKLRADANFAVGRKFFDNVSGYGILFGRNMQLGKLAILLGGFQYYDYWNSKSFELGTIGFGSGMFTKLPISKTINLHTNINIAIVPFAGNSTRFGPDLSQVRDYVFGGGLEGMFESTINIGEYATASLIYYYYAIRTYVGAPGNNFIGVLKPRITVRLYKYLSVGLENFTYFNDRYLLDYPGMHSVRSEQKIFLLLYFQDSQRRGHYN